MRLERKQTDRNLDKANHFIYNFYEVIELWIQQEY